MVSGVRTPYIMVLDASRLVVDEYVDNEALAAVLASIKQPVQLDTKTVRKIDILTAWFDESTANPLPGTDAIRAACLTRIREAQASNCTQCDLNAIKTEYRGVLENAKLI